MEAMGLLAPVAHAHATHREATFLVVRVVIDVLSGAETAMAQVHLQILWTPKRRVKSCRSMPQPVRRRCTQAIHLVFFALLIAHSRDRVIEH